MINDNKGLTLIEVVFAIAILAFVLTSTSAIIATMTRSNTEAGRRTQATDLATYELEALRNHRDRLNIGEGQNLASHMSDSSISQNSEGCWQFVVRPDSSSPTQWRVDSATEEEDYSDSDVGANEFESIEHFKRQITMCEMDDNIEGNTVSSQDIYDIAITVSWLEGGIDSVERDLTYRTIMATPEGGI